MFTLNLTVFPGCGCRHFVVWKPKTDVSEVLIGQLVCGSQSERSVHPASAFRINFRFWSDEESNKFCGFLVNLERFYAIYCANTTWITIYYLSWLFLCETNVWQGPGQRKIELNYYWKCKFEIGSCKTSNGGLATRLRLWRNIHHISNWSHRQWYATHHRHLDSYSGRHFQLFLFFQNNRALGKMCWS